MTLWKLQEENDLSKARKRNGFHRPRGSIYLRRESHGGHPRRHLGVATIATNLDHLALATLHLRPLDQGVVGAIAEELAKNAEIHAMTAAVRAIGSQDGIAGQSEIAHRIQELVAYELVREAKALGVHDAIISNRDSVLQRGAKSEAGFPIPLDVTHEAERARARDLTAEDPFIKVHNLALATDHGMVEIDLYIELEAVVVRTQLRERASLIDADRPQHLHETALGLLGDKAHLKNSLDEARRAAIEDRNLRTVDLDEHVINTQSVEGGHQVLDRRHRAAGLIADDGAELSRGNMQVIRLDEAISLALQASTQKHDTMADIGGVKHQTDRLAGMNADSIERHYGCEGRLLA
ncbi:hypothetical protein CHELA41_22832 [Hyphomicrobiales bacterium]|nr:hypothetical protein CHELA41_22832 [Hyphomicrobiales bacterium]